MLVVPELLAGLGIDRIDVAERSRDEHHAIDDDRRGLQGLAHVRLKHPRNVELVHVACVDLLGGMEALLVVIAIRMQEIGAVARRLIKHCLANRRHVSGLGRLSAGVLFDLLSRCGTDRRKRECKCAQTALSERRHGGASRSY